MMERIGPKKVSISNAGRYIYGFLAVLVVGLLAVTIFFDRPSGPSCQPSSTSEPILQESGGGQGQTVQTDEVSTSRRNAIVRAAERVAPAVVSISVTQVRIVSTSPFGPMFRDPIFDHFFPELRREYQQQIKSMGSGFLVSSDGLILTNGHVVENATKIIVNLPDDRQFEGHLVGSDTALDLALLKIDGHDLPSVIMGDSDSLIIGEWAIAIGNPYGYVLKDSRPSVTVGVISAIGRDFDPRQGRIYRNMIQTDAAINQGNSGGPLVNSAGEVIGINTFIFTESGGSLGVGFAIPINTAKRMAEEIAQYGEVRPYWTGIHIQNLSPLIAQSLGYPSTSGVIVSQLDSGSPALAAGLQLGDIITAVNDREIHDDDDLLAELHSAHVGDRIRLTVWRDQKSHTVAFTLVESKEQG